MYISIFGHMISQKFEMLEVRMDGLFLQCGYARMFAMKYSFQQKIMFLEVVQNRG